MAGKYLIELILRLTKQGSGAKEVEKELEGVAAKGKKVSDNWKQLVGGGAAVAGAFMTVKKAIDWGREGATIVQTAQSFDLLMEKVGASADTLDQLRSASLNTVDDMRLMSATTTLLAGAQGALATDLAKATPELMEIAKAANKLNPTLGDTTFLYESLATGIKRASPMILDNLGLTIRIGEANEKYAATLGKTAEALTAEEQKQALLNATVEAGRVLIEQAGGNVEAMGDSFAQAETKIKNATDSIKAQFAPAVAAALNFIAEKTPEVMTTTEQLSRMAEGVISVAEAFISGESTSDAWEMAILDTTVAMIENLKASQQMADAYGTSETRFLAAERALATYSETETEAETSTEDLEKATKALGDAVDEVRAKYEGFYGTLASGIIDFRDLQSAQRQSASDYEKALADLQGAQQKAMAGMKLEWESSLPDPTDVKARMEMAADAWDEWGLRFQDIMQNGIASPWYDTLQQMGMVKPPDQGVKEWAENLKNQFYEGELPDLINAQSEAWQSHAQVMAASQAEATSAYNSEVAKRKAAYQEEVAALKAAREEQLAAEAEMRQRATLEMSLSLAEQSGMLEAWSQQKFGPDFASVADSASEVLNLIDSGMIAVDGSLQRMISNTAAGIQQALDQTGSMAEQNKAILGEILSEDYAATAQERLEKALDLSTVLSPEDAQIAMASVSQAVTEGIPEDPFGPLTLGFQGAAEAIMTNAQGMDEALVGAFQNIGESSSGIAQGIFNEWVGESVLPDIQTAGANMQSSLMTNFQAIGGASRSMVATVEGGMQQMTGATNTLSNTLGRARKGFGDVRDSANKLLQKVNQLIAAYRTLINLINQSGFTGQSPPPYSTFMDQIASSVDGLADSLTQGLQSAVNQAGGSVNARLIPALSPVVRVSDQVGRTSVPLRGSGMQMTKVIPGDQRTVVLSGDRHNWYINDPGSARLAWALVNERREQRLNSFMGVG